MTNAKSSQNHSITTAEMCDAAVTKVRFDRVQFIRRASYSFGPPDIDCSFAQSLLTYHCVATLGVHFHRPCHTGKYD